MSNLGFKEKIGYGLGDGASNIIWQTIFTVVVLILRCFIIATGLSGW